MRVLGPEGVAERVRDTLALDALRERERPAEEIAEALRCAVADVEALQRRR